MFIKLSFGNFYCDDELLLLNGLLNDVHNSKVMLLKPMSRVVLNCRQKGLRTLIAALSYKKTEKKTLVTSNFFYDSFECKCAIAAKPS